MSIGNSMMWKRYSDKVKEYIQRADPTVTDAEIEYQMNRICSQVTVPIVSRETTKEDVPDVQYTLYQVIDMLEEEDKDTIISANGTIVEKHENDLSPFVNMLINWKKERARIKKKMFAATDAGDEDKARYYNKLQLNLKSNKMNALYGILALVSSAFFHEYVPIAVTCSGRQLISTSAMLFESIIGNNCKFLSMGECLHWIETVVENHKNDQIDDYIIYPTSDMVYKRLESSFIVWPGDEYELLRKYVENLDPHDLVFVYYANNLVEFIRCHPKLQVSLKQIFTKLPTDLTVEMDKSKWDKYGRGKELNDSNWRKMIGRELFLDPTSPPECVAEHAKFFRGMIMKYCYARFIPMSVVSRMNKQRRKAVAVCDTDSNMVHGQEFVKLCLGICEKIDTGCRDIRMNSIIATMIIAYLVEPMITDTIALIFHSRRVEVEYYHHMVMKNEWYYPVMLISNVKKRYAGHAMIQEGLILPKFKADIKGFDFKKAAIPKPIQDKMIRILIDRILLADEVDVNALVTDVNNLSDTIKKSMENGSTEYWRIATYKAASAYAYPSRIQVHVGGELWNKLYPENRLESLDKACVGKLKKDAVIKGVHCGKVIAVPMTSKQVPQEIVDQLDIDLMVYNIISAFNSVLDCFEIPTTKEKTSSGAQILKRSVITL